MKSIFRYLLLCAIFVVVIFSLQTKSFADDYTSNIDSYKLNQKVTINDFSASRNLICTNSEQTLNGGGNYKVRAIVNIKGNYVTGTYLNAKNKTKKVENPLYSGYNGRLAYYLANGERTYSGFHGYDKFVYSLWKELADWKGRFGTTFNLNNIIGPESYGREENTQLLKEAKEYASKLGKLTVTNGTTNLDISRANLVADGTTYNVVGPFKFTFTNGTINSSGRITVKSGNNSLTYTNVFNSNGSVKKKVVDLKSEEVFYLRIPANWKSNITVTVNIVRKNAISAKIVFMKSTGTNQNLAIYNTYRGDSPYSKTFSFTIPPVKPILEIIKYKANTGKKETLSGAKFEIYKDLACKNKVASGTTGANGKLVITSLEAGVYYVKETQAPSGYELSKNNIQRVNLVAGATASVSFENEPKENIEEPEPPEVTEEEEYGLVKYIKDTKVPIEGVRFKVWVKPEEKPGTEPKTSDSKYWTNGNYTGAKQFAKDHSEWEKKKQLYDLYVKTSAEFDGEYTTDDEGKITFPKLPNSLTYYAQEIALPEDKKDYFEMDNSSAVILIPNTIVTFTNKRIAIDLEGFVWQEEGKGKQHTTNNLYDSEKERLVQGIKVVLKKDGEEVDFTDTDLLGHYEFKKLKVEDLNQYTVEFEYNGMKYSSIPTMVDEERGSKASDIQNMRDDLDYRYNTIDKSQETNASDIFGVDYKVSDYKSEIIYHPNSDYAQPKYNLIASTEGICDLSSNKFYNPANDYINNINLGIKEREQPDLALTEDIDRVEVSFNGESHTFKYGERTEAILNQVSDNMTEKFTGNYANMSYTRTLFPSDIAHPSDSLEVKSVYKIGLENQATTLEGIVNEFKFYFDDGYEMTDNEIDLSKTYSENKIQSIDVQNGVAVVKLNQETKIMAQTRQYVYVVTKVKTSKMEEMLIRNTSNEVTLNSFAEITSYTTLDDGEIIAGVDVDSRPDSVDINNLKTFEDDTDRAPGFNLMLQEERSVNGTVFEDKAVYTQEQKAQGKTEETLNSGEERKGNGHYDDGEPRLANITVRLTDSNGDTVDRYDLETNQWIPAETITDDNGDYVIDGIIPGLYQIRYIWGNQEYIVENYKSTIVNESIYQAKLADEHWYSDSFKSSHNETGLRYSDALDDQELRKQIDEQSNDMKYQTLTDKRQGNAKMTSITPNFKVNYEYSQYNENVTGFSSTEYTVRTDYKNGWTVMIKADKYNNKINEIDLGIIRRAKQELKLDKNVKRLLVTLQNGQVLIDANVVEKDGIFQLESNIEDTVYIPISNVGNGMLKVETSNEIIQSANLSITYQFNIRNIGEVEYLTEDYYKYGKVPATQAERERTVVKLKPESMIDYMDNAKIILQSEDWKLLEKPYRLVENGFISPDIERSINGIQKVMQIDNMMKDENAYLLPEGMSNSSANVVEMEVSRLLALSEDFDVGNDAELLRTVKTGGSIVIETHGNYDPVNTSQEQGENDNSTAEDVTITDPTGENHNYIVPIVIGISALVILGTGIVLIRKFVLK